MAPKAVTEPEPQPVEEEIMDETGLEGTLFASVAPTQAVETPRPMTPKDLKHIIMVYADNTFEVLSPR